MPAPPTALRVRETIRHGEFTNTREITIEPTWAGFCELLATSPYPCVPDTLAKNRFAAMAFAKLLTIGATQHGWADYQVIG